MNSKQSIEEAAKGYANMNFESCKYHYADDERLTNFDELYNAYKEGAEQFKAQEQKPVDATVEMLNDIISWEKDLSEYHSLEGILRERYKITKR